MNSQTDPRAQQISDFLADAGWGDAKRHPLGQDASTRRYIRLVRDTGESAMLMDAPGVEDAPCPPDADDDTRRKMGWNAATRLAASRVDAFMALAGELKSRGLSAPDILHAAPNQGLALIEDFGAGYEFARLIEAGLARETDLYTAASDVLVRLHSQPPPAAAHGHGEAWPILDFDALALQTNVDLFAEWYPAFDPSVVWDAAIAADWQALTSDLIERAMARPRVFTLRDFHAENLIWLPGREGPARVGLLDFQDAVRGWASWDLAMLTQDARREVSRAAREAVLTNYCAASGTERSEIDAELALIGTLNALRITGLFARLIRRDQKPRYGAFLDRQKRMLAMNLAHPDMADMAGFMADIAPQILEEGAQ